MTFHISPRRRLQSARRRAASAERRRRKMRRVKGVFSGKGHFLFLRAREKCARVCVYSLPKNDDCSSFLSCCVNCKYLRFGPKYKTRVSLSFFLSFDDPSTVLKKLLLFLALVLLLFLLPRQTKRILRPLVLGTLFRASSFRSRGARSNELPRRVASSQ